MKKKIWNMIIGFFIIMLLFTVISRKLNELSKAVVEVESTFLGTLDYSIEAQGKIENSSNFFVGTIANQQVESIYVQENQKVAQGETLFSVNMDILDSKIEQTEREIESLKLQIEDAKSTKEIEEITYQNNLTQAQENYNQIAKKYEEKESEIQNQIEEKNQLLATSEGEEKTEIQEEIEQLQKEYESLSEEKESEIRTAKETLNQASIPLSSNSEVERISLELEEKEEEVNELIELKNNEGQVNAPFEGIITKMNMEAGEMTSESSGLMMTGESMDYYAVILLTEEQRNQLKEGDVGKIEDYDEDVKVKSIRKNEEAERYEAIVDLQGDNFSYGNNVTFSIEIKSNPYSCCIPLSALRVDTENNYYVLVAEEKETILGTELIAKRINVNVLEKNGTIAAIEEGTLDSSQKIITESSKAIEKGSMVRLKETNEEE